MTTMRVTRFSIRSTKPQEAARDRSGFLLWVYGTGTGIATYAAEDPSTEGTYSAYRIYEPASDVLTFRFYVYSSSAAAPALGFDNFVLQGIPS